MAHLQQGRVQSQTSNRYREECAPRCDITSCMPRKRGREFEQNSDIESYSDTDELYESDSGSEFDGVSTTDEGLENISSVGAEFRQIIQKHKEKGPSKANHAEKTEIAIETGKAYFEEHVSIDQYTSSVLTSLCQVLCYTLGKFG